MSNHSEESTNLPIHSVDDHTQAGPICRHLRSKGMYVYTDGVDMGFDHDYDNTIYWCLKTMKSFGPDDEMVEKEGCCRPDRACYQPL